MKTIEVNQEFVNCYFRITKTGFGQYKISVLGDYHDNSFNFGYHVAGDYIHDESYLIEDSDLYSEYLYSQINSDRLESDIAEFICYTDKIKSE